MSLAALLETAAARWPDRLAVADGPARFTYADFACRSGALAGALARRGVGAGDRVAILGANSHRFLEAYFAAAHLGAVLAPLNVRLAARELAEILDDAGARCILADRGLEPLVVATLAPGSPVSWVLWSEGGPTGIAIAEGCHEEAIAEAGAPPPRAAVDDDDLAQLYYTSGTTGRPKGVMLTHGNVRTHAAGAIEELGLSESDVWGHVAPLFHLADAWATFAITQAGGVHAMVPRFSPEALLDAIELHRISITNLVPTMLNLLVKHPGAEARDTSSLRRMLSGGAPIAPALVRDSERVLRCEYVQTYGLTETSPYLTFSLLSPEEQRLPEEERLRLRARTGRPARMVEVRVVDDAANDVQRDDRTVGEVIARGPTVTRGYWNRPEETAAAIRGGWLHTGDLATIDARGSIRIVDRRKDVINTGGEKVYSVEVENALSEHPAILEVAAFALPDAVFGERVAAAVVLRPGASASADALQAFCRDRLGGFKTPRTIRFLEALPRTGSGKIAKRLLRDDLSTR